MDLGIAGLSAGTEIGVGASAIVYRARQIDLDREVAVKVLTTTDPAVVRRFEREAKTLGKLSRNGGIVTVYDTGVNGAGQPYLLLELCRSSLLDRLRATDALDPYEACTIMAEVAAAVGEAHDAGVVHRDIKPANVLVSQDRRHLVSDFGISTTTSSTTGQTRSVGFTAGYVAPETLSGGDTEAPADVYGIGATLFHLVAGKAPFVDDEGNANLLALVNRITNDPLPDLRTSGVPDAVCAAIEAAMDKDPSKRPTAAELAERLEAVVAGAEDAADDRSGSDESPSTAPVADVDAGDESGEGAVDGDGDGDDEGHGAGGDGSAEASPNGVEPAGRNRDGTGPDGPESDGSGSDEEGAGPDGPGSDGVETVAQPVVIGARPGLDISPPSMPSRPGGPRPEQPAAEPAAGLLASAPAAPAPPVAPATTEPIAYEVDGNRGPFGLFPGQRIPLGVLVGGGTLLVLAVIAFFVWTGNRDDGDGTSTEVAAEAAGPELADDAADDSAADPSRDGNAQDGVLDPSGPPELRSNLDSLTKRAAVPDIVGDGERTATASLEEAGFRVNVVYEQNSGVPTGRVISQDPPAGGREPVGSLITLFVSRNDPDPTVTVPGVAGDTVADATATLEGRRLTVLAETRSIYHDTIPADAVVGTEPPSGATANRGAEVTLFVSLGKPTVPDLTGRPRAEVDEALEGRTLTATYVDVVEVGPIGTVHRTDPAAGTEVDTATEIQVFVIESNPPDCPTAALAGLTEAEAEAAIRAVQDCTVGSRLADEFSSTVADGRVIRAEVTGREVRLVLSKGPELDCAAVAAARVGEQRAVAEAAVTAAGCDLGAGTTENSDTVPAGAVISATAAGTTINLVISLGPATGTCVLPDVAGDTVAVAKQKIQAVCDGAINAGGAPNDGIVVSSTPGPGEIDIDQAITLVVEVTVPDVVGMAPGAATTALATEGLGATVVEVEVPADDPRLGTVFAQNPAAGATARVGSAVTIRVGVEEPPPPPTTT